MYNFVLIFDITTAKSNITRMVCCGFVVINWRSEAETIILSLHLGPVMPQHIRVIKTYVFHRLS
jgi:hypothetical protein